MNADSSRIIQLMLADGRPVSANKIIGRGIDGYVIRNSLSSVIEIPKLNAIKLPDGSLEPNEDNVWLVNSLDVEKEITTNGIELEYYGNGDLENHIRVNRPPPWDKRMEWILQVLDFVLSCHDKKVLWFDIALRNLLLAEDGTLRAIDFANSTAAPMDADLSITEYDGYTAKTEVLHVTNVIYSISKWTKHQTDCVYEHEWPDFEAFPSTEGLELGTVMANAWKRQYNSIAELRDAILSTARTEDSLLITYNSSIPQTDAGRSISADS
ncbi:hypothetical protein E4T47_09177 [Aureobasidium subglaciale]|nr:hypothetical protein E4T47_09177 [Aureobasidium subglaciale]